MGQLSRNEYSARVQSVARRLRCTTEPYRSRATGAPEPAATSTGAGELLIDGMHQHEIRQPSPGVMYQHARAGKCGLLDWPCVLGRHSGATRAQHKCMRHTASSDAMYSLQAQQSAAQSVKVAVHTRPAPSCRHGRPQ